MTPIELRIRTLLIDRGPLPTSVIGEELWYRSGWSNPQRYTLPAARALNRLKGKNLVRSRPEDGRTVWEWRE